MIAHRLTIKVDCHHPVRQVRKQCLIQSVIRVLKQAPYSLRSSSGSAISQVTHNYVLKSVYKILMGPAITVSEIALVNYSEFRSMGYMWCGGNGGINQIKYLVPLSFFSLHPIQVEFLAKHTEL